MRPARPVRRRAVISASAASATASAVCFKARSPAAWFGGSSERPLSTVKPAAAPSVRSVTGSRWRRGGRRPRRRPAGRQPRADAVEEARGGRVRLDRADDDVDAGERGLDGAQAVVARGVDGHAALAGVVHACHSGRSAARARRRARPRPARRWPQLGEVARRPTPSPRRRGRGRRRRRGTAARRAIPALGRVVLTRVINRGSATRSDRSVHVASGVVEESARQPAPQNQYVTPSCSAWSDAATVATVMPTRWTASAPVARG